MTSLRLLTEREASFLSDATEHWLRLRDVEVNQAEVALKLLRAAALRPADCRRQDIASVNWTVDAQFPGTSTPVVLTLVAPAAADARRGRVSMLSALGLALLGHALGAVAQLPLSSGHTVHARLMALRPCQELIPAEVPGSRHVQ
jgi:transcription elongation GreA/GreB family factor